MFCFPHPTEEWTGLFKIACGRVPLVGFLGYKPCSVDVLAYVSLLAITNLAHL